MGNTKEENLRAVLAKADASLKADFPNGSGARAAATLASRAEVCAAGDLKARLQAVAHLKSCRVIFCSQCHPALKGHGPAVFCNLQVLAHTLKVGCASAPAR